MVLTCSYCIVSSSPACLSTLNLQAAKWNHHQTFRGIMTKVQSILMHPIVIWTQEAASKFRIRTLEPWPSTRKPIRQFLGSSSRGQKPVLPKSMVTHNWTNTFAAGLQVGRRDDLFCVKNGAGLSPLKLQILRLYSAISLSRDIRIWSNSHVETVVSCSRKVNLVAAMVSDALGGGDVVVEGVDPWWF